MVKRTITGICLSAFVLTFVGLQGYPFIAALTIALFLASNEVMNCLTHSGARPIRWLVWLYCLATGLLQAVSLATGGGPIGSLAASQLALLASSLLAFCAAVLRGKVDLEPVTVTLFLLVYPGLPFAAIYALNAIEGRMLTVAALVLTFFVANLNDLFALLVGLSMGKHKLSPEISPKKTVEGAVAGLVAAVAFSVLLPMGVEGLFRIVPALNGLLQPLPPWWQFALMGLAAGAASQLGDLAASMIKRHCGAKDFGAIFPGHGGIMDRIDGVLFSGMVVLIFFLTTGA